MRAHLLAVALAACLASACSDSASSTGPSGAGGEGPSSSSHASATHAASSSAKASATSASSATTGAGGAGGSSGSGGGGAPHGAGTIVPLYVDPPDDAWDRVAAAATAHPTVKVIAVVNPFNGPGADVDADYTAGIAALQDAGVVVIGYVRTKYGMRAAADVDDDVDTWASFYPSLDGIFFDEMSSTAGDEAFYSSRDDHAKSIGLGVTVGNPGTDTLESFVGTVDTMLVYETDGLPTPASLMSWHGGYPPENFGVIPYKVPAVDGAFVSAVRGTIHYVYMTDDDLPNPWDTLPAYFDDLLAALE